MKATQPKRVLLTIAIVVVLIGTDVYLFGQNVRYSRQNRELLLRNDSLLSVNLDLSSELNKLKKNALVKSSGANDTGEDEN